jgi:hypothetical protein
MLEVVAYQVSASQQNIHMLNKLLHDWMRLLGSSISSTLLLEQHLSALHIAHLSIASHIEFRGLVVGVFPKLQNLPEECVHEVLLLHAEHRDLESFGKA